MLKQPVPSRARWLGGSAIVMALALFAGVGAWAAQPKAIAATSDVSAGNIKVQLWVRINGGDAKPPMVTLTNPGEPFSFEIEDDGHLWALTGSSRMLDDGKLHFSSAVSKDGATFAEPSMIVTDGEPASLVIGEELDGGGFEGLQVDVVLEVMTGTVGGGPENGFVPVDTEGTVGPVPDRASRQASPPRYPEAALEQGISGKLVLLVDIDSRGRPTAVEVETAEPAGVFDQAAMDAVRNWKFEPAIENGRPAASRIRVPIHFEADGRPPGDKSAVDETIGWFTPDLSKDPPRVAEVTCDEARADTEGKEVACGNRLVKPNDTGTPPDPTKIEMPIEPRTGSPVIDAEILAVPDTLPLVAGVEACPEGAFLGPASVGKGRQMACLSRDDGGNQHQNLVDRIRRSIVDRGGALVAKF